MLLFITFFSKHMVLELCGYTNKYDSYRSSAPAVTIISLVEGSSAWPATASFEM